ncbi:MAG: metallophosphatase family protein [Kiritimatiellae bacterium]|nr:metallophosphatase family protein [Kiritimatiellia bacterium]
MRVTRVKYAIVSDLHANLPAWRAVLRDIVLQQADRILCLGDVVGYGPQPVEVLESLYAEAWRVALGNHDAVLTGRLPADGFHELARDILERSRRCVGPDALRWMATWPLQLVGRGFRCAHASSAAPGRFDYVEDPADALAALSAVPEPLVFIGHTHRPALFVLGNSGTPHRLEPQDFELEPGKRYLVNVGSVGCPRDGDPRASYVLFDAAHGAVWFRRVAFDLDACRIAIAATGWPEAAAAFLRADPLLAHRPIREVVSFRPPQREEDGARGAPAADDIERLRGRARRWRHTALVLAGALVALVAATLGALWWVAGRSAVIPALEPSVAALVEGNLLAAPRPGPPPFEGWSVRYGNRRTQSVTALRAAADAPGPAFRLESDDPARAVELVSRPLDVTPGRRLQMEMLVDEVPPGGEISIAAALRRIRNDREEIIPAFVTRTPSLRRREGWLAQVTAEIPAGGREIEVRIYGRFRGAVNVRSVRAVWKGNEEPPGGAVR